MTERRVCGVIMPIGASSEYTAAHWSEVLSIISEAARDADFEPMLVSDAEESTVIQRTIVTNIYENDVVVCDVSSKNPNVMLELGMRLAFDKPTVIIKDKRTDYSFDTSPLKHIAYPHDLRFYEILSFKEKLTAALKAAVTRPQDASFLKAFGAFKVASPETQEVPMNELLLDEIRSIRRMIRRSEVSQTPAGETSIRFEYDTATRVDKFDMSDLIERLRDDFAKINVHMQGVAARGAQTKIILTAEDRRGALLARRYLDDYFNEASTSPEPAES